jgi:hypothetical protein
MERDWDRIRLVQELNLRSCYFDLTGCHILVYHVRGTGVNFSSNANDGLQSKRLEKLGN